MIRCFVCANEGEIKHFCIVYRKPERVYQTIKIEAICPSCRDRYINAIRQNYLNLKVRR